jgi:hypothetical protein
MFQGSESSAVKDLEQQGNRGKKAMSYASQSMAL